MKKLTHTLALSTILLGVLSPTARAIADTIPTEDTSISNTQTSEPVAQAASSHVAPNIDWTNWQNRGVPSPTPPLIPNIGEELLGTYTGLPVENERPFSSTPFIADAHLIEAGDTIPSIEFEIALQFTGTAASLVNLSTITMTDSEGRNAVLTTERSGNYFKASGSNFIFFFSEGETVILHGDVISSSMSNVTAPDFSVKLINIAPNYPSIMTPYVVKVAKVYYKDAATGIDISPSEVLGKGGKYGDSVTATSKNISGYNYQSYSKVKAGSPDNVVDGTESSVSTKLLYGESLYSAETSEGNQAIVFWYDKAAVPAAPVTLHYVDQDGNAIPGQADVTLQGNVDDPIPFSDNTPTIPGYTLDSANQPDPTSTFTDTAQTFNIPYTRNQGTAVNVRYVDEKGQQIAEPAQITGFENQTKPTDPYKIDIPGYTLDESKLPVSEVTLSTTAQPDVVFTYKQNPGSITLKYEDEQGQALAEGQTLEEDVTTPFTAEDYKLDIPGYYLTSLPTNVTQFTSDPQTAIYKYAVDQTALEAHDKLLYVGDSWSAEDTFDSITSEDGTKTTILPSDVVVEGQVDTSKVGDYTVTYTWTNPHTNKRVSKSIVVHVVDKSTIIVHDSTLTVGDSWAAQDNFDSALNKKGDKVPFDQIKVDGAVDTSKAGTYKVTYTYDETNSSQVMKAEVGASHQGTTTVTATIMVKDKAPVAPGNPDNPGEPTTPGQPDHPNGSGNTNNNTSGNTTLNVSHSGNGNKVSNKALPDTGEENNVSLIASGLGMLLALMGLILFREAKQKKGQ